MLIHQMTLTSIMYFMIVYTDIYFVHYGDICTSRRIWKHNLLQFFQQRNFPWRSLSEFVQESTVLRSAINEILFLYCEIDSDLLVTIFIYCIFIESFGSVVFHYLTCLIRIQYAENHLRIM